MITLHTFGPALGLPDTSPFVTKAMLLLKIAGLPYKPTRKGFGKAPKGKLPYIEDDGAIVADSTFIRLHIEKKYGIDLDRGLSQEQRAIAWSVEKMLEDHLYWAVVEARWCDDANFARGPATYFNSVPWPMRGVVAAMVRGKIRNMLKAHGMGRHSKDEIALLATKDIEALAAILGDKPYLMGDAPCGVDATAGAWVIGMLCKHFETPIRTAAEKHPNLVAYGERMLREYFPELAQG
ncbi:MAG TPA: glutathione S-transferase family protein [Paucimonas sp.]|nr:glutathione S-transferase family protein [Paucimonas sp.]